MQRILIVLVVGLLVAGCGEVKEELTLEEQKLRDSVVGEYEQSWPDGTTHKLVFLENGVRKWYVNGNEQGNQKWAIVNGEIHVKYGGGSGAVLRINKDKSITKIAKIEDGKRTDLPKEKQSLYKKIK